MYGRDVQVAAWKRNHLSLSHSGTPAVKTENFTPQAQKLAEMKFWDFSHRSRNKTWSDKLGGIWGEILVGRSAQHMKHENAQKISSKISPNFSPNSSPRISQGRKNDASSLWGMSGVKF